MSSVKSKKIPSLDKPDEERFWSHVQQENGERMFEAKQIRKLLEVAPPQMNAMILLRPSPATPPTRSLSITSWATSIRAWPPITGTASTTSG